MENFDKYLYPHQKIAILEKNKYDKCLINMWCGTGKTRTFTISIFQDNQDLNVIVFPSLGLIGRSCKCLPSTTPTPHTHTHSRLLRRIVPKNNPIGWHIWINVGIDPRHISLK